MDINIILGIIIAGASIYYGAPDVREDLNVYLQLDSIILVLGGTIASTFISTSLKDIRRLLTVFRSMIFGKRIMTPKEAVDTMVQISELSQTGNKQALLAEAEGKGDGFLLQALNLMAAGLDKDFIDRTLESNIEEVSKRHNKMIAVVRSMGSYAPMFGMAGTVIGVVQVLKNVTDIDNIVSGMALALLTTLYGLFLSSVIFIPMASKLRNRSEKELVAKEIIREGMYMIMDKEIPLKVKEFLSSYLSSGNRSDETED